MAMMILSRAVRGGVWPAELGLGVDPLDEPEPLPWVVVPEVFPDDMVLGAACLEDCGKVWLVEW